jgi:hypothetical protein
MPIYEKIAGAHIMPIYGKCGSLESHFLFVDIQITYR